MRDPKKLHRPGLTPAYGLRRAKVVFSGPSTLFISIQIIYEEQIYYLP